MQQYIWRCQPAQVLQSHSVVGANKIETERAEDLPLADLQCPLCAAPHRHHYIDGRANGKPPHWTDLLAGGELFLISAALAADAIGRAFQGGKRFRAFRITCGIGCVLLLLVTSIYFGRVAFSMEEHRASLAAAIEALDPGLALQRLHDPVVDRLTVADDSFWLFVFTGVCALGAILVEEEN